MSTIIILTAALLPAILLWLYICMKDPQPEPLSQLAKATIWGMALCIPVGVLEVVIDAIAMSGTVNAIAGGLSTIIIIYFCIKMHKVAHKKITAHIQRDADNKA